MKMTLNWLARGLAVLSLDICCSQKGSRKTPRQISGLSLDSDSALQCGLGLVFNFSEIRSVIGRGSFAGEDGKAAGVWEMPGAGYNWYTGDCSSCFSKAGELSRAYFPASSSRYKNGKENAKILQCAGSKGWETDLKQGSNLDICTINVFLLLNMCVPQVCIHMYTYICTCVVMHGLMCLSVCICTYVCMAIYVCAHVYMHVYMHICPWINM